MNNKKGNISVTVLTAIIFIFSTILLISTIYTSSIKKQISYAKDHVEVERVKDELLVVGTYLVDNLSNNNINFDTETIINDVKLAFELDINALNVETEIEINIVTSKNRVYYRLISFDGTQYTITNTLRK